MMLKKVLSSDTKAAQLFRFCIVGGIATVLQYGMYVVFVNAVHVKAVPSTLISYAISFVLNYVLSSLFTFKRKPNATNMMGFIFSHAVNMGMQTGIVAIFKGIIGNTLALLPALAICVPANFLMVRFFFNKSKIYNHESNHSDSI